MQVSIYLKKKKKKQNKKAEKLSFTIMSNSQDYQQKVLIFLAILGIMVTISPSDLLEHKSTLFLK